MIPREASACVASCSNESQTRRNGNDCINNNSTNPELPTSAQPSTKADPPVNPHESVPESSKSFQAHEDSIYML